jgi:hypothetical protein
MRKAIQNLMKNLVMLSQIARSYGTLFCGVILKGTRKLNIENFSF